MIAEAGAATPGPVRTALLDGCEALHRQLRPGIPHPYHACLEEMISEGAHLAVLTEGGRHRALAVWRVYRTTLSGRVFQVDDLVADEGARGRGFGSALLAWLEDRAHALECDSFTLCSGVGRSAAHRFYFRAGLVIVAFAFEKQPGARVPRRAPG